MKRNILIVLLLSIITIIGAGFLFYRTTPKIKVLKKQQPIAIIISASSSSPSYITAIRNMINLFSEKYDFTIKRYESDGSSAGALKTFNKIYRDGIRKVCGPFTSQEFDITVQQFVHDHPDMLVVTASITSPNLGTAIAMPNFFRIVASDEHLIDIYGQLLPLRLGNPQRVIVLVRDDAWGKAIVNLVQKKLTKQLPNTSINIFPYQPPEHFENTEQFIQKLSAIVQSIKANLQSSQQKTAILLFSFAEIIHYINLVINEPLFAIPHFGSSSIAYSNLLIEDSTVAKFLSDIKFEALVFFADNARSSKRIAIVKQLAQQRTKTSLSQGTPSTRSLIVYDALYCLAHSNNPQQMRDLFSHFYGISGYIEVDALGSRSTGTFIGAGIVSDGARYRWAPLSFANHEVLLPAYHTTNQSIIDVDQSYTISWDKELDVEVTMIGADFTIITPPFKPANNYLRAMIAECIVLKYYINNARQQFFIFSGEIKDGIQIYMNIDTKDFHIKKTSDNLHIAAQSEYPTIVKTPT